MLPYVFDIMHSFILTQIDNKAVKQPIPQTGRHLSCEAEVVGYKQNTGHQAIETA